MAQMVRTVFCSGVCEDDLRPDAQLSQDLPPDVLQVDAVDDGVHQRWNHQELCGQYVLQSLQMVHTAVA